MGFLRMSREDKVTEFRRAAGKGSYDWLNEPGNHDLSVMASLAEEFNEFVEAEYDYRQACRHGHGISEARANLCKEWADLQYVVSQAAAYYEIPGDASFNRVHNSNMTKVAEGGKIILREDGKILKPEGYKPVDMSGL